MHEMTCEEFERDVSAHLEGEPAAETRGRVEAHAARCGSCSALIADLRRISAEARALPSLSPSRDLWSEIESRIEAPVIALADGAGAGTPTHAPTHARPLERAGRPGRTWQVSTKRLAAAAAALIAVSSGATYLLTSPEPVRAPGETVSWVVAGDVPPGVRPVSEGTLPDPADYDAQISELRGLIAERRSELDSATVSTIERSLGVIDAAIIESREALARDPASPFLHEQLDRTLARKVELLRTLARLSSRS